MGLGTDVDQLTRNDLGTAGYEFNIISHKSGILYKSALADMLSKSETLHIPILKTWIVPKI